MDRTAVNTCPDERFRNGERAAALAERANDLCEGQNPRVLDTLAAAYAAAGRFPEAVKAAHKAQQLATQNGNSALANAIEERLACYALEKTFVEPLSHFTTP